MSPTHSQKARMSGAPGQFSEGIGEKLQMKRQIFEVVGILVLCFLAAFPEQKGRETHKGSRIIGLRKFVLTGYPPLARQARVEGEVSAVLHLDENGAVQSISDVQGPALLRDAIVVVKYWQFFVEDHQPNESKFTFRFLLDGPERENTVKMQIGFAEPGIIEIKTNPTTKPGPDVERSPR
jgi:TonB-like protein